jgi:hypothetical protein
MAWWCPECGAIEGTVHEEVQKSDRATINSGLLHHPHCRYGAPIEVPLLTPTVTDSPDLLIRALQAAGFSDVQVNTLWKTPSGVSLITIDMTRAGVV